MLPTQASESESGSLAPSKNTRHTCAILALGSSIKISASLDEPVSSGSSKGSHLKNEVNSNI